jgi:methylated-DNA-[protein]-cysteine S-methyltransferase
MNSMKVSTLLLFEYHMSSPVGTIILLADKFGKLRALDFLDYRCRMLLLLRRQYIDEKPQLIFTRTPPAAVAALENYFSGNLADLASVEVSTGGTRFQQSVWAELRTLEPGQLCTYSQIAKRIGNARSVRAVGAANGANPNAIVVPCHRVIGADGSLTGFGGGLERKRWLIAHEAKFKSTQVHI